MRIKKFLFLLLFCLLFSSVSLANDCKLAEFKQYADKLDKTKIVSVELLAKKYQELTINHAQNCISKLFSEFRSYYYRFMRSYEKTIEKTLSDETLKEDTRKKIETELNKAGWELRETEGSYYIGENGTWFIEKFGNSLPDDWKKFLQQRKKEINKGFSEDAGLLIPWDELRTRIIYWEDFLKQYPSFQERSTVDEYLSIYFRTYLTGMDNSIIFDYKTEKVYPEVIKSYENYLKENKQSKYYKLVEGQYNILKKNSFIVSEKTTEELKAFYKANKIEPMWAVQPPTY